MDFEKIVLAELDFFERHPERYHDLSWKHLIKISGKSRSTLWRNIAIRNRYNQVKSNISKLENRPLSNSDKKKLSKKHKINTLEKEIEELKFQRNMLIESLIAIYQQIDDQLIGSKFDVNLLENIYQQTRSKHVTSVSNKKILVFPTPRSLK